MKVKIRVEDKNKFVEVPIKVEEVRELYDEIWRVISYYNDKWKKLSKDRKRTYKILCGLQDKLMHLVHDIIDKGIVYELKNDKFIKKKSPYYHKKPKWRTLR